MTFNNSSINTLGRDGDFCNVAPMYVYVKHHENGSFSKADETLALPWGKIPCDHLAFLIS
jgi:hypothetical protein